MAQYSFARLQGEYRRRWQAMTVIKKEAARQQALLIAKHKKVYQEVEEATGVPWEAVGVLHLREAGPQDVGRWRCCLHNGQAIIGTGKLTTIVPKNKGPFATFKEAAVDALVGEGLAKRPEWKDAPVEFLAYLSEKFNGFGYRNPKINIASPYLWGGTSEQVCGKYVSDGKFSSTTWDSQIGTMAVLKELIALSPESQARFRLKPEIPTKSGKPPATKPPAPVPSPKAEDTELGQKPMTKSKTVWGGIIGYLTSICTAIGALFEKLGDNPWAWGFLFLIFVSGGVAAYMIIKGRWDVQKMVEHLTDDDTVEEAR
jgi:lysozyme family protein